MRHISTKLTIIVWVLLFLCRGSNIMFAQTMEEIIFPQYLGYHNSGQLVGTVFRIQLQGLNQSTQYDIKAYAFFGGSLKYANYALFDGDSGSAIGTKVGAGTFTTSAFKTDANGNKNLWVVLFPTSNTTFFATHPANLQVVVEPTGTTITSTITSTDTFLPRDLTPGDGADSSGALLLGTAESVNNVQGKFVFAWDNTAGTGRPLSGYVGEDNGIAEASYPTGYVNTPGNYGFVIPSNNPNGIQRIEVFKGDGTSFANNQAIGGFAGTVNPAAGSVVIISAADGPLPVELVSFTSTITSLGINLQWKTATEINNSGFEVQRAESTGKSSTQFIRIGFVQGNGNSNSPKSYSFVDENYISGQAVYRLKQIDNDGSYKYSTSVTVNYTPTKYELSQNYSNPFNPVTTIKFQLPDVQHVILNIYNILGERVKSLVNDNYNSGNYSIQWDATNDLGNKVSSRIYLYRIQTTKFTQVHKMLLLK